jgi:hypothetical protein
MATFKKTGFAKQGGGATIGFPDVCKVPAPFVPVPYPNVQFQENPPHTHLRARRQ